jgi:hypothetical protein
VEKYFKVILVSVVPLLFNDDFYSKNPGAQTPDFSHLPDFHTCNPTVGYI